MSNKIKNICIQPHVLPWEVPSFKRGMTSFFRFYTPRERINLHLHLTLNLSNFHTDWAKTEENNRYERGYYNANNGLTKGEIITDLYSFIEKLGFSRSYLDILTTKEPNGHIDTWKHTRSNFYDGYIMYCSDTYYHKDYLNTLLDIVEKTDHELTWISPTPDTERYKTLDLTNINEGKIGIARVLSGGYCMGFGWFDYISTSILNLVGWPDFECYGPYDSYMGFIMTELYRSIPQLDYGHYNLTGDVIKPDCVFPEDEEHKARFVVKQNKEEQRKSAEQDFFGQINRRLKDIYNHISCIEVRQNKENGLTEQK